MPNRRIGVFTPNRENAEVAGDLAEAYERVLRSGYYLLGPELEAFEVEAAEYLGVDHFVGVGSGTDALILTLRALGVGPGDEVIVPAFGAVPTVAAVIHAGGKPVLADVDMATGCLSCDTVGPALGPKTVGVIAVHLYGYPAEAGRLAQMCSSRQLFLIEDCAQAFGAFTGDSAGDAKVGTAGIAGCFSFYPTKILAALGDAGGVATNDGELAEKLRLLRSHGHVGDYRHVVVARNSRMDELQAAFLRVKLARIDGWIERRRSIAQSIIRAITDTTGESVEFQARALGHAYHLLAARHRLRDEVIARCRDGGVDLMVHYPVPIHRQRAYEHLRGGEFGSAERWAATEFSLPTSPQLAADEIERIAQVVSSSVLAVSARTEDGGPEGIQG
jgi:dTDP-4-amino-4,6-dideoxygalactose transaminase